MNKVTVSAPGKLMLMGEYAVLNNSPCLVTAVNQRMRMEVETIYKPEFFLDSSEINLKEYKKPINKAGQGVIPKEAKFVEIAVKNIYQKYKLGTGLKIKTKSQFSSKFGFGSSSASTVCAVKALSELFGLELSKKEIFDISFKSMLDVQGEGSGFDIAAAVFGGTLYFKNAGKTIEVLDVKSLPLVVGYSGIKADTVTLISKVNKTFSKKKEQLNIIYNEIEDLVDEGKMALVETEWKKLGDLMNKNQNLLKELGVSIDKLDKMIAESLRGGAFGAKLSGAGGGDCIIALTDEKFRVDVCGAIKNSGGEIINIKTNAEGIRVE